MKTQLIFLCSAALLSTAAIAEDTKPGRDKGDTFATLDLDSDGKLSQEEVAGHGGLASNFAALDGNSDGYISKREFRRNTMPKPKD